MQTIKEVWQGLTDLQRDKIRRFVHRNFNIETGELEVNIEELPEAWRPVAARIKRFVEGSDLISMNATCCGRETAMDGLLDIRPIAVATRVDYLTRAEIPNPETGFLCGACRGKLFRSGVVKKSQVAQRLGASAELIAKYQEQEA